MISGTRSRGRSQEDFFPPQAWEGMNLRGKCIKTNINKEIGGRKKTKL